MALASIMAPPATPAAFMKFLREKLFLSLILILSLLEKDFLRAITLKEDTVWQEFS